MVIDKVSQGGFILVDNVLWGGKVLRYRKPTVPSTEAIQRFNRTCNRGFPGRESLTSHQRRPDDQQKIVIV